MDQLSAGYDVSPLELLLAETRAAMSRRLEAALERQPARLLASETESFRRLLIGLVDYSLTVATGEQLKHMEQDVIQTVAPLLGEPGAGQLSEQVSHRRR